MKKKPMKEANIVRVTELSPMNDSRKSFYGKAKVLTYDDGSHELQSYDTIVSREKDGKVSHLGKYSQTTSRHQKEFEKQFNKKNESLFKESMSDRQLAKEIEDAVKWLIDADEGCSTIKLDDKLAVCVGWQDGYDADDESLIHSKSDPSWAIVAGIKVWTSDDMRTDFDWINSPYNDEMVFDNDISLDPNDPGNEASWLMNAYNELKKYLDYNHLTIEDDGKIVEDEDDDDYYDESLKEDTDRKLFKEFKVLVDGRLYEVSHTEQRKDEIVGILKNMYPNSEIEVKPYKHYESGYERKRLERIIAAQLKEYGVNESLNKKKVSESKERGKGMRTLKESYDDYNYYEAVKEDVESALEDDYYKEIIENATDRDEAYEELYDKLWVEDSVTGNASGSYTFNTYKAEENICHNLELLCEAIEEFGGEASEYKRCLESPETADVTIRCYLLGQVLSEVLDGYEFEG